MLYNIPPKCPFGQDTAAFWEDFFTEDELKKIIDLPQWNNADIAEVGLFTKTEINKNIRISDISWVFPESDTLFIYKKVSEIVAEINSRFFHFNLTGMYEAFQLSTYSADSNDQGGNGHYDWHNDFSPLERTIPRKLSMSLLLSDPDEFEGGELQIKPDSDNAISLEQKKGRAWFFPSYTLHRVAPVTKGVRRSLVLWVGGPQFT